MKCEHFVQGYVQGKGIVFRKTPSITQLLSQESLRNLICQGGQLSGPTVRTHLLCKEHLVAVSYLRPTVDECGRSGVWNHTILIPCGLLVDSFHLENMVTFITEPEGLNGQNGLLQAIELKLGEGHDGGSV
jgi:hypothetical protein